MNRKVLSVAGVLAGTALLAACGGDDTPAATTELSITGTYDLAFEPDEFAVPVGEEVTIEFTAEATAEHDLVIEDGAMHGMAGDEGHGDHDDEDHAMDGDDLHAAHADAGETVTATLMMNEPGTYQVYCSVPGHREAGMEATLTVVDDA